MTKHLLFILGIFISIATFSQKVTISGFITDSKSSERLINASIYEQTSMKGTITNTYGFYSLTLPVGNMKLTYSFVGYQKKEITLNLKKDTVLNVALSLNEAIEEITVIGDAVNKIESTEMSVVELQSKNINKIPTILGEPDLLKVIQLLPGVQSGTEGTSGIYVRGGGPDQNLFLLDGVPIYNVNHLMGFFSVFNPSAIKTLKLYKGGFPARFGGRLSSVLDIKMKEGNMQEFKGEASVGLISSRFSFEGPIIKDKTSFIVSGRRTYADLLLRPVVWAINKIDQSDYKMGYYFYDLNAKVNHKFSDKSRLYLSGYFGQDKAYSQDNWYYVENHIRYDNIWNTDIGWGNGIGSLRWNYLINNKLFSNATLTYSKYNFGVEDETRLVNTKNKKEDLDYFKYFSGIEDISAKIEFDYIPNPNHSIKFGLNFINHNFNPGINRYKISDSENDSLNIDKTIGNDAINANEMYLFGEDNFSIGNHVKMNIGLHLSGFYVQDVFYPSLQPRASIRYKFNDSWSVKASYAKMTQNIHLLSSSTISLPTDLWLPTTKKVKPQDSHQYAMGTFFKLPWGLDLSIEGYYKTMSNLIEYSDGASFSSASKGWEEQIEMGKGWSYGCEFLLEKQVGKTTGWLGYTLSKTERQFKTINFGNPFPARFDRRHDVSLTITHKFSERIDMGIAWVYGTGNAVTLGKQVFKNNEKQQYTWYNRPLTYYEGRNNYRMPSYNRLDWNINFHRDVRWGKQTWSFSVYNAYNRQNPFFLYWGSDYSEGYDSETGWYYEESTPALKQRSLFPIIPSISYTLKF